MRRQHVSGGSPPIAPPFRLPYTSKVVIWAAANAAGANTTQGLSGNQARHQPHYEDVGGVYDAMIAFTSSGVGNTASFAVYSAGSDDAPATLLWASGTSSTNSANTQHVITFAGGTWQAAGAAYKDSSDRLVLTRGQKVWLVSHSSGNVTWRVLQNTTFRNTGFDIDFSGNNFQGFQESTTYPTFPATATPVTRTAQMPALGLRWVA